MDPTGKETGRLFYTATAPPGRVRDFQQKVAARPYPGVSARPKSQDDAYFASIISLASPYITRYCTRDDIVLLLSYTYGNIYKKECTIPIIIETAQDYGIPLEDIVIYYLAPGMATLPTPYEEFILQEA